MLALDVIKSMFQRGTKSSDLRGQLAKLEQEKQSLRYDQKNLETQRAEVFERTKAARKRGDQAEVMFHLHELKGLETETKLLLRESSRLNKAMLVLRHYARRLERLERNADYKQIATFIERFRASSAMTRLEEADINDDMFAQILDDEMSEIDRELGIGDVATMDDGMKDMLDKVDAMIEAEREGDESRIRDLKKSLNLAGEQAAAPEAKKAAEEKPLVAEQNLPQGP